MRTATRRRPRTRIHVVLLALVSLVLSGLAAWTSAAPAVAAPCDPPVVNPVACENTLPGNPESEWGITGSGSASIQGFATDISVDQGGTIGFKVDTSASSYRLDLYRMGYYSGMGARKVATVTPTVLNNQPSCITVSTTGLVDCGNWTQNASWTVPGDAVSGIYFARLVRTDGTAGASHVFFVVRDDDGGSDLLFQTSDTTWQAYNTYGGNSLYTGSPAGRAYKVSYNRPFTTRANAPEDWVFNAEYPMVRFLESNGYDVSYTTGVDTDRRGGELLEHEAFLSVGHDEYWSGQQRTNVEAARAAGVDLAFFSGNEVFWKTRWENSVDGSGTPHRTLVSYKETHAGAKIDPLPNVWTGTWRDPRFSPPADGGRPENALTGQIFTINCCAIDMVVGAAEGRMRFWRDTRVAALTGNQTTTIGDNVIGYEWDEDLDNGSRPAGSIRVSQTQGSGDRITDHGSSYSQGQATHSMTLYRHQGGALVFGAGTIQWPWALDDQHDRGSAAADVAAQQATVNLLADMGAQPATLRPGLVAATASTDTTAPTSAITSPAAGATLPVGSPVTVTGTATDAGGGRVGGVEVSTDGGTTWHRATGRESWSYTFTPSASGTTTIRSRATDDSVRTEAPGAGVTVTVGSGSGGACPCSIWPGTATPERTDPDASPVELGVKFRASSDGFVTGIRFHKPSTSTGTHVGSLWSSTGTRLAQVTFTNESASGWQQASFATPVAITAGTTYVASYFTPSRYSVSSRYFQDAGTTNGPLTALQDGVSGGNGVYRYTTTAGAFPTASWQSENYWVDVVFTESAPNDSTKPTVSGRAPTPGSTGVSVGTDVSAVFSEAVTASSISFALSGPGGPVAAATTYDVATRRATLDPAAALEPTTTYTATLSGARDAAGNTMDPVSWSFTTDAPDTSKPTVTARTPSPGAGNVSPSTTVEATFSEAVQAATITLALRGPGGTAVPGTTAYDAATRTVAFTPTGGLAAGTAYTVDLSGARDLAGNVMDPVTWGFTTATSSYGCPCSIWAATATPQRTDPDRDAVELGVRFRAATSGFVTGIRFYKPVESTGTHVGSLWSNTGTRLATVTFTGETASGWQQASFASPVAVSAGTTYVASYHTPSRYSVTGSYFTTPTTRGPLTALQDGTDGANGVFRYSTTPSVFPNQTYRSENYWVDVVFTDTDTTKPAVTSRTPAPGATGVALGATVSAVLSEPVDPASIALVLRGPDGTAVPSAVTYDASTRRVTLTPDTALAPTTTHTATLSGARDPAGNEMDPVSWSFTTETPDTTKPTLTGRSPSPGATGVAVGAAVTATFSEVVQAATVSVQLLAPGDVVVPGTTSYDAATRTVRLAPGSTLAPSTTYTVRVSGARDVVGNQMDPDTWSFTTEAPDSTKPQVAGRLPAPGATSVATGSLVSAMFDEPVQAGTVVLRLRRPDGTLVAAATAYDSGTRTATLTPDQPLALATTYTAEVSGARDLAGNQMDPVSWSFTTTASSFSCPCSIWPGTATPDRTDADTSSVELGVRFRASTDGYVTGIRYYRPVEATGTHVGSLWTGTGTRLASVTFTGGTASGWQQATFANPVPVTAGTTYVASYFTPSRYAVSSAYFGSAVTRGPLTALADGTDGGNGLYRYSGTAGVFPNSTYNAENYWVDVVFAETASDDVAPTVTSRSPAPGATGVVASVRPSATFSEAVTAASVDMVLRHAVTGTVVPSTTAYDAGTYTATLTPASPLAWSTPYTVSLSGARDAAGNPMAPVSWDFETSAEPPPPPEEGPGGPVAVVTSQANRSSTFLAEILRAEGLNEFTTLDTSELTAATLADHAAVVLGDVAVTDAQVAALQTWVSGGGNLVLLRPDTRLLPLAGLTAQAGTVSNGYLRVDPAVEPAAGITAETMQFHGTAQRYGLSGATTVAELFTTSTAGTGQPAVAWRSVGTSGGQVATFAYDLSTSVIWTRQGNPAWAGQDRDGQTPNRSNDLFLGGASPDWVDLAKVAIPQADEQQRLLANLLTVMLRDRFPLPRFWYFPGTHKAVVVATGDDHAGGGTAGRMSTYNAAGAAGCSVARWECPRFTSYVYPGSPLTNGEASAFHTAGFEIGLHPQNGCANYSSLANLQSTYETQLGQWRTRYTSIPAPTTSRYHCIVWSDWASQPRAELSQGIRLDTNYYYYPGSWIADRPGFMTGSGMPMRFTDTDGSMIDVYQATTQMTDESQQSYPFTPNTLLDRALGTLGYYGAFTANLHTDNASTFEDTQVLASAQARGVPVVTARQLLTWLDGRNGSSYSGISWAAGSLSFTVQVGAGADRLTAMLPTTGPGGAVLSEVRRGGTVVPHTLMTVKGQQYAVFTAVGGAHQATYGTGGAAAVTGTTATTSATGEATVEWTTSEPGTSVVRLGTSPTALDTRVVVAGRTTDHVAEVEGLRAGIRYHYRVLTRGPDGATTVWPVRGEAPASFTTRGADRAAPRISGLRMLPLPDGTARVSWRTSEPATSRVRFGPAGRDLRGLRLDDGLVRRHTVVLTGLVPRRGYALRVVSHDAAGNTAATGPARFRSAGVGLAMFTAEEFRTGTTEGALRVDEAGLGALSLQRRGWGGYTSRVLDSGRKTTWLGLVLDADVPRGARVVVRVRAGDRPTPDDTWSDWRLAAPGSRLGVPGRYVQYAVSLSPGSRAVPTVRAIGLTRTGGRVDADEH